MTIGVLLIAYLSILYLATMLILWRCLGRQKPESTLGTEIPFVLKEGQTIVGVGEPPKAWISISVIM
jgi:hypothetical protein